MTVLPSADAIPSATFSALSVFALLFLAMLLALAGRVRWAALVAAACAAFAVPAGLATWLSGLVWLAGGGLAWAACKAPESRLRVSALCLLAVLGLALGFHAVPGFQPLRLLDAFGREAAHPLVWSLDKGVGGLLLLCALPYAPSRGGGFARLLALVVGVAILLAASRAVGLASWAPQLLPGFALFVLGNLFLTVVAEEAFFRGLLLGALCRRFGAQGWREAASLVLVSLLFALVHLPWGMLFAALAGCAGLFYGLLLMRYGLAWAILGHAAFNAAAVLLLRSPLA